jgi:crossover junction endodeoxyribonuclease RuvC
MVILGLDPGSVCTGYGLIDAGPEGLRWCAGGVLRPARGRSLPERLLALHAGLREILQERRPAVVALEESFVGQHARSALILGQARGALTVAILAEGVPLFEYAPRLVKLAVTGTGGASKEQVHAMIQRLVAGVPQGLSFDVTDALALAVCHAHRQAAPLCLAAAGGPRPGRGAPRREA